MGSMSCCGSIRVILLNFVVGMMFISMVADIEQWRELLEMGTGSDVSTSSFSSPITNSAITHSISGCNPEHQEQAHQVLDELFQRLERLEQQQRHAVESSSTNTNDKSSVDITADSEKEGEEEEVSSPNSSGQVSLLSSSADAEAEAATGIAETLNSNINDLTEQAPPQEVEEKPLNTRLRGKRGSKKLKIGIYMTSHLSKLHKRFLEHCWPAAVERLPLVRNADLIVYTSADEDLHLFTDLKFPKTTIYKYKEDKSLPFFKQKQQGAIMAMVDPFLEKNQWFRAYDWIIRLNPDVVIRDDKWLLQQMHNTSNDAIFVNFTVSKTPGVLHTDFYAFRPHVVDYKNFEKEYYNYYKTGTNFHAETHIVSGFQQTLRSQRYMFLPNVSHWKRAARVQGKDSDVLHVHWLIDECPNYFNATNGRDY